MFAKQSFLYIWLFLPARPGHLTLLCCITNVTDMSAGQHRVTLCVPGMSLGAQITWIPDGWG